jgi:hypothetical protein
MGSPFATDCHEFRYTPLRLDTMGDAAGRFAEENHDSL